MRFPRPGARARSKLRSVVAAIAGWMIATVAPLPAQAVPSLVGQTVTVTERESGFADTVDSVLVGAGPEIQEGDATSIGSTLFLSGEFIDLDAQSIVYQVHGGGAATSVPGFLTTGLGPDARYIFSDLNFGPPGRITGVTIELLDVVGVALESEVLFDNHSVTLMVGTLGVRESPANLGLITLGLQVEATPEPGPLALLGLGLGALGLSRRWAPWSARRGLRGEVT